MEHKSFMLTTNLQSRSNLFPANRGRGHIMLSLDRLCELIERPQNYDLSSFEKVKANVNEKIYEKSDCDDFPMNLRE